MKTLRLIMLAAMACAVLTCCTEELTNENGNGGNNNGGTTTPTQYMWPKYRGLADFYGHYTDNVVLNVSTDIDTTQYGVWLNVYMRGRLGDTLIKVEPDNSTLLSSVRPFDGVYSVKYKIYIGDTTHYRNMYPLSKLCIKGDSVIITNAAKTIEFRGVKCD